MEPVETSTGTSQMRSEAAPSANAPAHDEPCGVCHPDSSARKRLFNPELAAGRWQTFSLVVQLANVGSEVERAMNWAQKGRPDYSTNAFYRGLELLDLTIADPRHRDRLGELTCLREALLDRFLGPNEFGSTDLAWHTYFDAFGMAAALERERCRAS
jgi:hypothetical protein